MKTSLDKIVETLLDTEGRVAIISREHSPQNIMQGLVRKITGKDIAGITSKTELVDFLKVNYDEIMSHLILPTGDTRFTALSTMNMEVIDIQVLLLEKLMEEGIKVVITQPKHILFYGSKDFKGDCQKWVLFMSAMESMYSVEFKIIDDESSLKEV